MHERVNAIAIIEMNRRYGLQTFWTKVFLECLAGFTMTPLMGHLVEPTAAIFSDSRAHLGHRRNHSGFFRGDSRRAGDADNPVGYRRFVVVDRRKVEKSAGSAGNTGSISCATSCSLQGSNFEPPSKTKTGVRRI